jgi:hypothetical protein
MIPRRAESSTRDGLCLHGKASDFWMSFWGPVSNTGTFAEAMAFARHAASS